MSVNYQQVHEQAVRLGENASQREERLSTLREKVRQLFEDRAGDIEELRRKVSDVAGHHDPNLHCALPVQERLDAHFPQPSLSEPVTFLALDGSQINPDRHAEVEYGLINIGAVTMRQAAPEPPSIEIESRLLSEEELVTPAGMISEETFALRRDLEERKALARLARLAPPPVITFTDGPIELWGARDTGGEGGREFRESLNQYLGVLSQLCEMGAITAGYVDRPGADLVVRLLEVAAAPEDQLANIWRFRPFRGVRDWDLYASLLETGERSAVFAIQSKSAESYTGLLALHFFYLNVGRSGQPSLARVEVPAWVVANEKLLNLLHAGLVEQCRIMGSQPYPYILHRAHEAARVTFDEKEEVTRMILHELDQVSQKSAKQSAKDLAGKTRYKR